MEVLLYPDFRQLPFACSPKQPKTVFKPEEMENGQLEQITSLGSEELGQDRRVGKTYIWPFLMGIHELELPLLAHVSIGFENGIVKIGGRLWVQFTTISKERDENGIPLILGPGLRKEVELLWTPTLAVYGPSDVPGIGLRDFDQNTKKELWTQCFARLLQKEKATRTSRAIQQIAEAKAVIELFRII
jgi:hypothetical protein